MSRGIWIGILICLVLFLTLGVVVSYRAYYPIVSVKILLAEPMLRADGVVRVDTVSSGRAPISIRVELVQGDRSEIVVIDRVTSRNRALWNLRAVQKSTYAPISRAMLERFTAGQAVVRATVVSGPTWLRQPPPVVHELATNLQVGPAATK